MSRGGYNNSYGNRPGRIERAPRSLDQIHAPYTFVPLAEHVVDTESGGPCLDVARVSQDVPFSDGIVGALEVEIQARTPLFIRDPQRAGQSFKLPDGHFGIPGSSLRGMLRNVVEIASFGRMRHVNDDRYGVRDLHNRDLYGQHMAAIVDGKPTPLVSAGWLRKRTDDEEYPAELVPCDFAKIHYKFIMQLCQNRRFEPGRKQSAPDKYRAWGDQTRAVSVETEWVLREAAPPKGAPPRHGDYGVVRQVGRGRPGTLVFTGQPQNWSPTQAPKKKGAGNPKQHDFVFFEPDEGGSMLVPKRVWDDFCFVHRGSGEQHRLEEGANDELKHWLKQTGWEDDKNEGRKTPDGDHPLGIPVFFLMRADGSLRAMGLAMMFRLAYELSIKEAVANSQGADEGALSLAELIFGYVPLDRKEAAAQENLPPCIKGRVAFSHTPLPRGCRELGEVRAVLGTPKASYYPSYVEQNPAAPGSPAPSRSGKPAYKTWMDQDARVRGWKRYPPQQSYQAQPPLPDKASDAVISKFRPVMLPQGEGAVAILRVHNLRPFELGALLWTLDFGGSPRTYHSLGMAKSLGYGSVRLSVKGSRLKTVRGGEVDLEGARRAYVEFMEGQLGGKGAWARSPQIVALQQAATLGRVPDEELRHMEIAHKSNGNEFQLAKQAGLALPAPYTDGQANAPIRRISAPSAATSRPASSGGSARLASPRGPAGPSDELRAAMSKGKQYELLAAWVKEGGGQAAARRRAAVEILGELTPKNKGRYPDIAAWLEDAALAATPAAVAPPPGPAPAAAPRVDEEQELLAAMTHGGHIAILQTWIEEGGARAKERRAIAQRVLGNPSKKMQTKYPELITWMKG